jgi:hypothetical protein
VNEYLISSVLQAYIFQPDAMSGGHAHAEPSGSAGGIMGGTGASGVGMLVNTFTFIGIN